MRGELRRFTETQKLILLDSFLVARIRELCAFPNEAEASRIISGLRWIGLFSQDKIVPRDGNLFDTLCGRLEGLMQYGPGERDLVILQHRFVVEWQDGRIVSSSNPLPELSTDFRVGNYYLDVGGVRSSLRLLCHGTSRWPAVRYRLAAYPGWCYRYPWRSRTVYEGDLRPYSNHIGERGRGDDREGLVNRQLNQKAAV